MPFFKDMKSKLLSILLLFLITPLSFAGQNSKINLFSNNPEPWKIEVAPYLWTLNMNGRVQLRTAPPVHVDQTFGDILSELNWAGMLWLEASKDKFGIFANALYASLSNGTSDQDLNAHLNANFGLYSAGLSYRIYKTCFCPGLCEANLEISPYLGGRYTSNRVSISVNSPSGSVRTSSNQGWLDPILGARFNINMNKSWLAVLAGDVGGTNFCSDFSYNLIGLLGFRPQTVFKGTTWYLGYRLLDQHYITGSNSSYFNWDMKLFGPVVSLSFTF